MQDYTGAAPTFALLQTTSYAYIPSGQRTDDTRLPTTGGTMIRAAMSRLTLRRLAHARAISDTCYLIAGSSVNSRTNWRKSVGASMNG